jgi:group I intron endonuclease
MSSGVYLLNFRNGDKYIGKSVNIERRWEEHIKSLAEGKSAKKLQAAYNKYGVPERSILIYCHNDHIDLMETIMIRRLKPTLNSAVTVPVAIEDIGVICNNSELLQISTGRHIEKICTLGSLVERLENEIEFLLDEDEVANELYSHKMKLQQLSLEMIKLESLLEKEKQVTWWQRLWR